MKSLIQRADAIGVDLYVQPASGRNLLFYQRFGFVLRGNEMIRRALPTADPVRKTIDDATVDAGPR